MHLKGMELQGFKSFADRTVLDFENGITAVVGPNGSGKSNIADAMKWVMGEQSAKSLRGGNMQDVIFSGTQKRKPLGFAEVSLIIDNTDKQLAVDFDEVVITRRLFRSGESEYYINKSSVRLKDIHELFMDTGVGKEGYSMIGQGKIAEIVSTKSEDRRSMFEEAAGITKFRYRKEEAERKLSHTNDNVLRVNDIISEIEGQIGPLKAQSEKAKKYLNYRDKLKVLEVNLSLKNIEKYRSFINDVSKQTADINAQLDLINSQIAENEKHTEGIFAKINDAEKAVEENREKQQLSNQTLSEYQRDIEVLKSKINGNNENVERLMGEITELNSRYDEFEKSVLEEEEGFAKLKQSRDELDGEIAVNEEKLSEFDKNTASDNEHIDDLNTEIIEKMNESANIRSKISNYNALIQSSKDRYETISNELNGKSDDLEKLKNNVDAMQADFDSISKQCNDLKDKAQKAEDLFNELNQKSVELRRVMQDNRDKLQQSVSRHKLLVDMEKSFDNYSKSVKAVMNEHSNGSLSALKIYGTVASTVTVDAEYSTAIEVCLGASAQNIITETEDDAKKAIEFLKRSKVGRATFLPISAAKGGLLNENGIEKAQGFIGIASDLVKYDKNFEKIITGLLGRIVVVDNIDNAVKMARSYSYKFRVVTLSGELLAPNGSMSGGSRVNTAGLFSRANEIVELDKSIKILEKALVEKENEFNKITADYEAEKKSLEALKSELSFKNNEFIKVQSDLEHTKTFYESILDGKKALEDERVQINSQIDSMNEQIKVYEADVQAVNDKIAAMEKEVEVRREAIGGKSSEREKIISEINDLKAQKNEVVKDIELVNQKISMVNMRKQEISLNIEQKNNNIEEMKSVNEDISDDIEFKLEQIEGLKEEIDSIKSEIEDTEKARKEAQESIRTQQEENKKLRENQLAVQQEYGRIESKKEKTEADLENVINRLWEDYELTVSSAEELRQEIPSDAQKQANSIKESIKALGNINIDAIEEYNRIGERYEFLKSQRDDLVEAQKNLEQVIADMMLIMKQQFTEKFSVINGHFNETFTKLFGGGKAELILTEPNDVLNSGVEIKVQPPGKAVKSLLQLSGGEQAFVSIALLFAILKVRPSPFCVLDEIEAALDDVNVYRLADYLKDFSKSSQFIVITHRRGTMEAANVLYGVTMQEQGVSRLLSLNIDDVVEA